MTDFLTVEQAVERRCPNGGMCLAEACMAWRYAVGKQPIKDTASDEEFADAWLKRTPVKTVYGYCGLAGRPEI